MTKLCSAFFKYKNNLKICGENYCTVLKCTQMRARVEKVDVLGWNKSLVTAKQSNSGPSRTSFSSLGIEPSHQMPQPKTTSTQPRSSLLWTTRRMKLEGNPSLTSNLSWQQPAWSEQASTSSSACANMGARGLPL